MFPEDNSVYNIDSAMTIEICGRKAKKRTIIGRKNEKNINRKIQM